MKFTKILIGMIWICISVSCKQFLDVKPQDRFLDEQVFETQSAIHSALNGIYINMAKYPMYGARLSMRDLDVMAQYYNTVENTNMNILASYNYTDASTKESFSAIWEASYQAVLNANTFLMQLKRTENVVSQEHKDILMGEAYAIRAYVLFDMLRLFGPVYQTDSLGLAIPYPTVPSDQVHPILPANMVMDSVLNDIDRAILLLKDDPIRTEGVKSMTGDANNDFYRMRNRRFNYYGVMALKSRVLLYRNDKAGALSAAKQVLTEAKDFFKWTPGGSTMPNIKSPDRSFSSEIILGIQNAGMYDQQRMLFNASLFSYQILAPISKRLDEVFDNFPNDYRYRVNWRDGGSAGKTYKTFVKYEDVTDGASSFRYFQSLVRLTELYYIVAECTTDRAEALQYLNSVRQNRGLPDLSAGVTVETELYKEYRREFWGEGQTFFYFKRKARPTVPSGNTNGVLVNMNPSRYVVPLPVVETENR